MSSAVTTERRIGIVGTGFSGLCLGMHLKKLGIESFVLFEKAERLGGTWRDNTYPGAECDVQSALYSFSFERNPRWTYKWSEQEEILAYMDHCAEKYDLYPHMRFNAEVSEAQFEEETGQWRVEIADGTVEHFDVFVSGVGQLHKPNTPAVEGAERFQGTSFHSAQWNHDYSVDGKKICVIGNAASAVQFIPQIAKTAERVTVFQRSANWVMPKNDREYWAIEKWLGTVFPAFTNLYRFYIWFGGESVIYELMNQDGKKKTREKIRQQCLDYIDEAIRDPELRKALVPDYPIGAKRILFSDDFYEALDRDNVETITSSIARIVENGVETEDGVVHEADAIVYATGFDTNAFLTPMRVVGRGGEVLNDTWERDGAEAYLGITHTGFPNFFMMYGPNTNLGHNSILVMIESQTRYILSCLDALSEKHAKWLDVKSDVQKSYNDVLQERMKNKIWNIVDKSWYKTTSGKVTNNWVGRTTEYRKRTRAMNPEDYEFA